MYNSIGWSFTNWWVGKWFSTLPFQSPNQQIFHCNTFLDISDISGVMSQNLSDARDVTDLARFLASDPNVMFFIVVMSTEYYLHQVTLITYLSCMPLCLFNVANQHWVAMLLHSHFVAQHLPIPLTQISLNSGKWTMQYSILHRCSTALWCLLQVKWYGSSPTQLSFYIALLSTLNFGMHLCLSLAVGFADGQCRLGSD